MLNLNLFSSTLIAIFFRRDGRRESVIIVKKESIFTRRVTITSQVQITFFINYKFNSGIIAFITLESFEISSIIRLNPISKNRNDNIVFIFKRQLNLIEFFEFIEEIHKTICEFFLIIPHQNIILSHLLNQPI